VPASVGPGGKDAHNVIARALRAFLLYDEGMEIHGQAWFGQDPGVLVI
jgi:hypothetical protein